MSKNKKKIVGYVFSEECLQLVDAVPKIAGRAFRVHSLIRSYHLLDKMRIIKAIPASDDSLLQFHTFQYIQHIKWSNERVRSHRSEEDNDFVQENLAEDKKALEENPYGYYWPPMKNVLPFVRHVAGSSVSAAHAVMSGKVDYNINWFGGWHHAKRSNVCGFCYVNDVVLCILTLLKKFDHVLYVDLDLHHGVEEAFCNDPRIMVLSFHLHKDGYFPGGVGSLECHRSGRGSYHNIDVPLPDGLDDSMFSKVFDKNFATVSSIHPYNNAIVCRSGCSVLSDDPVMRSNLTEKAFLHVAETITNFGAPVVFLGGGSHNFPDVVRCWTSLTAALCGIEIDSNIPDHDAGSRLVTCKGIEPEGSSNSQTNKLVIPMPSKPLPKLEGMDHLTKEAAEELIKDATNVDAGSRKRLPIISRTRIEGVETTEQDFEDVPLEEFGKAMLRGMGWKDDDEGVPIYIPKRGFSCFENENMTINKELGLGKGSYCVFTSGSKKGRYGKVTDDDGVRMLVKMATSGETVDTCYRCLRAVTKKEYKKSKRYINSSKVDEADEQSQKYEVEEKEGEHRKNRSKRKKEREYDREKSRHSKGDSKYMDNKRDRSETKRDASVEKPRKNRKLDSPKHSPQSRMATLSNHNPTAVKHRTEKPKTQMWLYPNLSVRIIDKNLKEGKYFKEKVIIEDVVKPFVCNCRIGQTLIEGIHQDQLETVIPRELASTVMIVRGDCKSQVATLLHKDKENCKALVMLIDNNSCILNLDYDDICQFIH